MIEHEIAALRKQQEALGDVTRAVQTAMTYPAGRERTGPGGRRAEFAHSPEGRARAPDQVKQVSILDFKAPGGDKKDKEKRDSFEREIAQANKRMAVLAAETATIGLNTAARERAKLVAELETAAKTPMKGPG